MIVVVGKENPALVEAAGEQELVFLDGWEEVAPGVVESMEAVIGRVPAEVLTRAPKLRWVHSPAAGVDADLSPQMLASDVVLTSSAGNGAIPLAEHAMLLLLMLNRDVPRWMRAQAEHRWDRFTHGELAGQTLGIYGLGNAGMDLARKAQAFHLRVVGVRRRPELPSPYVDQVYGEDGLDALLAESDFVVVTAPSTPATSGRFGRDAFARMKPTAYFVCISRGGIADDGALLAALRDGQIAGAGLDAHGVEPLPPNSPFWDLPNVIVTPHNGATSTATARRGEQIVGQNLRRFRSGQELLNVVDKSAGY
ncbi:D-isomer specific 2-hydroxyacid dehydrogenase NAD-binding protein [Kribbella flavida DSM 17836]|uniref:D-isomer specific 2-hydroxyacid dehydrogenase NAD-binding protein n=1 Tax=Kribbella flavida (strain DSM 17836 / JCM 10339 / NBRC 14399) TaxID=479435 RepID=D2PY38_KRIFD|nr:D-2-hydroxyacid dehydrogenase [Kribbella flavida]ADB33644.1 D-isomer specific 2-hydroxyacid dehydrogenase NAD-binding protein [Kribbella flavida DSM 17836]